MSKILIVEDDKYLNKLLSDRFSLEGFEVSSVLDGDSAWKMLWEARKEEKPFEILLSDMLLPQMMGAELFTKIREDAGFSALKMVAMSGIYKDPSQIEEITGLHELAGYWTKPFDIDALISSLTGKELKHIPQAALSGKIKDTSIEKLFFATYDKGFTGRLVLRSVHSERKIYFMSGFPVAAESTAVNESFGFSLVQMKLLTAKQRDDVSEKMVAERLQFGQVLLQMKILTEAQLFDALRRHTYRLLLNTFMIRDGDYEYQPLETLPSHIMILEFNPALLILKAQSQLFKPDFIKSIFDAKTNFYCHRTQRFFQIIPLLNLDDESKSLVLNFKPEESLSDLLTRVPETRREALLRIFFALESLELLEWKSQPAPDLESLQTLDLKSEFQKDGEASAEVAKALQSRYVQTLNRNYFEILEVTPDSSELEINAAYREIRYQLHPDRFADKLSGQTKRILDDMLARIDKAYQTLTNPELRSEYMAAVKQERADSVADSKRYLEAQNAFREGLRYLTNNDFEKALERFQEASRKWSRGIEYDAYATYAAIKSTLQSGNIAEASKLTQKLRDVAYQNAASDIGFVLLGHAYLAQSKLEQARESYQKALSVNEACDDAANALAGLGEQQFKKERIKRAVQKSKATVKRVFLIGALIGSAGGVYVYKDQIFYKEAGIQILNPDEFKGIAPVMTVRRKTDTLKVTTQKGWLKTVPEVVMRAKCTQLMEKVESLKITRVYWYDEEKGIKYYCYGNQLRSY